MTTTYSRLRQGFPSSRYPFCASTAHCQADQGRLTHRNAHSAASGLPPAAQTSHLNRGFANYANTASPPTPLPKGPENTFKTHNRVGPIR